MKTGNKELLVVDFKTEDTTYYTKQSLLSYICDRLGQEYQVYHESDNKSIYAYLKNTSKNDVYVSLRVSDHDVKSRGLTASTGRADVEIIFRNYNDLYDLDEMIEDLEFDIEDYVI